MKIAFLTGFLLILSLTHCSNPRVVIYNHQGNSQDEMQDSEDEESGFHWATKDGKKDQNACSFPSPAVFAL